MKSVIRRAIFGLLGMEPFAGYARKTRLAGGAVVLMYHDIGDDDELEAWTVVRRCDFLRQIDYLARHFRIVSLGEALAAIQGDDGNGTQRRPMAVITFDDGYAGNHRHLLPIVESRQVPVTVFIATEAVETQRLYWYDRLINGLQGGRPIDLDLSDLRSATYRINRVAGAENWREIQRLLSDLKRLEPARRAAVVEDILATLPAGDGDRPAVRPLTIPELRELAVSPLVTIGAHSHCHNILTQLPDPSVRDSLETCKRRLEEWTGRPPHYFAYPNGSYDARVCGLVEEAGFKCALTTQSRPWKRGDSLLTIPRIGVGRYDADAYFSAKVSGSFVL